MIIDVVSFRVKPQRVQDFLRHNEDWVRLMRRARGFVNQLLFRSLDHPGEYVAQVSWVNRDYRDRFHSDDDADRRALQDQAREFLEAVPTNTLVETV
jgi:quinol monooxygenase YgiN